MWGQVLAGVPGSRLLLKNKPFACPAAQQDYLGRVRLLPSTLLLHLRSPTLADSLFRTRPGHCSWAGAQLCLWTLAHQAELPQS